MSFEFSYQLPAIPYLRLRFTLIAEQSASLPQYKGSMLRGAFGHALRHTVCVMGPLQPCPSCMLRKQCVYPRLFETLIEPDEEPPRFLRGLPTAPRPYVFEPFDQATSYRAGDALQFDLLLLGRATELFPYAIFAVSQMAERGLAARRWRFRLKSAQWESTGGDWQVLYDGESRQLTGTASPQFATPPPAAANAKLTFVTPTRLKSNGGLTMDFTFRQLVFKMLRRALELTHFHVPEEKPNWEFHSLLVAADGVDITSRNLQWVDVDRYSNRQHTEMKMGGFVGEVKLQGNLEPFLPLLAISEIVHIGKGCVFGNGKMVCSVGSSRDESLG